MSKFSSKLLKVSDSFTVYRYDNGFMLEISGRDPDGDWRTVKTICQSEQELFDLIRQANQLDLDN